MHPAITKSILFRYEHYTSQSPNAQDSRIVDHNTGAKPGNKPTGNNLCEMLNEPAPSLTYFYSLMPVWVKYDGKAQSFDQCKRHFNFESALSAYK